MKTASTSQRAQPVLRRAFGPAALLLCLVALSASAQESSKDYALIYGTVWGADSRAVAGVPVVIQPIGGKKQKWRLVSDRRGEFAQRVPTGDREYLVVAEIKVHNGGTKPQAKVHVYKNEREDVALHLTN